MRMDTTDDGGIGMIEGWVPVPKAFSPGYPVALPSPIPRGLSRRCFAVLPLSTHRKRHGRGVAAGGGAGEGTAGGVAPKGRLLCLSVA
jgi:hypothetical protein